MLKVKQGDLDKLGLLYERHKGAIFGYLYHMNKDNMLAEDLLQTVFIRVIKYKHNFRGDGKFTTWLFHIARNVNADHHRKNKRASHVVALDQIHLKISQTESGIAEKEVELSQMERALELLDAEKREVLVMTKIKQMRYKEVCEVLDISEGAVKAKVFRAMQALKEKYAQLESTVS